MKVSHRAPDELIAMVLKSRVPSYSCLSINTNVLYILHINIYIITYNIYIYTARVHHIEASSVTVFGALKPAPFMLQSQDGIRLVDTFLPAAFFRLTDIAASQFSQHVWHSKWWKRSWQWCRWKTWWRGCASARSCARSAARLACWKAGFKAAAEGGHKADTEWGQVCACVQKSAVGVTKAPGFIHVRNFAINLGFQLATN